MHNKEIFNKKPFSHLPLNNGDLFDLTGSYLVFLLRNIHDLYAGILEKSQVIHNAHSSVPEELIRDYFVKTETFVDYYSKIVKCVKLSLGEELNSNTQSIVTIFEYFNYAPDRTVHSLILNRFRNTQQHFEERLQEYDRQIDPFFKVFYKVPNKKWEISFGSGGLLYYHKEPAVVDFDEANLFIESYRRELVSKGQYRIESDSVCLKKMMLDIDNITELLKRNLCKAINSKTDENGNYTPPAPRGAGQYNGIKGNTFSVWLGEVEDDEDPCS